MNVLINIPDSECIFYIPGFDKVKRLNDPFTADGNIVNLFMTI